MLDKMEATFQNFPLLEVAKPSDELLEIAKPSDELLEVAKPSDELLEVSKPLDEQKVYDVDQDVIEEDKEEDVDKELTGTYVLIIFGDKCQIKLC